MSLRFKRLPRLRLDASQSQYAETDTFKSNFDSGQVYILLQYQSLSDDSLDVIAYRYEPNFGYSWAIASIPYYTPGDNRIWFGLAIKNAAGAELGTFSSQIRTGTVVPLYSHVVLEAIIDFANGKAILYLNGYPGAASDITGEFLNTELGKIRLSYNPEGLNGYPTYSSFAIEKLIIDNKLPSWWDPNNPYYPHLLYEVGESEYVPLLDEPPEPEYFLNCWTFHYLDTLPSGQYYIDDKGRENVPLYTYGVTSLEDPGSGGIWSGLGSQFTEVCEFDYDTLVTFDIDKLVSLSNASFARFMDAARTMADEADFDKVYLAQTFVCWTDTYLALYDRVRNAYDFLEFYFEYGAQGNSTGIDFIRLGSLIDESKSSEPYGTDDYWIETAKLRGLIIPETATSIYSCEIQIRDENLETVKLNPWELSGYRVNPASASTIRSYVSGYPMISYERTTDELRKDLVDLLVNTHPQFAQAIQNSGYTDTPYLDLLAAMMDNLNFYVDLSARQSDPNSASGVYLDYLAHLLGYTLTPPQPSRISVSTVDFSESKLARLISYWNSDSANEDNQIVNIIFSQDDIESPNPFEANASGLTYRMLDSFKLAVNTTLPGESLDPLDIVATTTTTQELMMLTAGEKTDLKFGNTDVYSLKRVLLRGPVDVSHISISSSDPSKTFVLIDSYADLQKLASIPLEEILSKTFPILVQPFRNGDVLLSFLTFPTSFRATISPDRLVEELVVSYYKFDTSASISSASTISPPTQDITLKSTSSILYTDSGNKLSISDLFNWADSRRLIGGLFTVDDARKLSLSLDSVIGHSYSDSDDTVRDMIKSNGISGGSKILSVDNRAVTEKDYEEILKDLTTPYKVLDAKVYPRYINSDIYSGRLAKPSEENTLFPFTLEARLAFVHQISVKIGGKDIKVVELVKGKNALDYGLSYAREVLNEKRLLSHLIIVANATELSVRLQGTIYYSGDESVIKQWIYGSFVNRIRLNGCRIGNGIESSQIYALLAQCPYIILPRISGWTEIASGDLRGLEELSWDPNDDSRKHVLPWVYVDDLSFEPIEKLTAKEFKALKRQLIKSEFSGAF